MVKNFEELINKAKEANLKIYEIAQKNEAHDFEISVDSIREKALEHLNAMKSAIKNGLTSEKKSFSGLSGNDCSKLKKMHSEFSLLNKASQKTLQYALATAEENTRMGKIVACPTAGACGIVPSVIIAHCEEHNMDEQRAIDALITAGAIGQIISNKIAIAGAVAGCQSECGVASAMASGALVELSNGTNEQILNAAILSLKNTMGLVCDPVAGLVEVPCVKRNAFMAMHAKVGAELALADIETKIPFDEVIDAVVEVGLLMSPKLKESSEGGLATTKTGLEIAQKLCKEESL